MSVHLLLRERCAIDAFETSLLVADEIVDLALRKERWRTSEEERKGTEDEARLTHADDVEDLLLELCERGAKVQLEETGAV